MLEPVQYLLGAASGIIVGFALGLVGGGGSILAVPLMVYLVGVANPHIAIGTSAFAVAVNAAGGLTIHARAGTVRWPCALVFAASGVAGAFAGSTLGKAMDGQRLLLLFALVMAVVGMLMLRRRDRDGGGDADCGRGNLPRILSYGATTGAFSGFFGIGGGFLAVPGLMASTGMPISQAVGSSLVAVTAFGLTTAINYAASGLVDWPLAVAFIAGGLAGGAGGARVGKRLARNRGRLSLLFASSILLAAAYMFWRALSAL